MLNAIYPWIATVTQGYTASIEGVGYLLQSELLRFTPAALCLLVRADPAAPLRVVLGDDTGRAFPLSDTSFDPWIATVTQG